MKDFGRAGRTKYTHLVDQDTTQVYTYYILLMYSLVVYGVPLDFAVSLARFWRARQAYLVK